MAYADPELGRQRDRERIRRRTEERRAAGLCPRCGVQPPAPERTVCPERRNARSRRLYRKRRAAGRCTACGAPSQGASRCWPCAKRSYENSAHFRGMPLYPANYAVFLRGTDECLAVFNDEMEVAAWLAFEKLSPDRVEVVVDRPWLAALTAWE